MNFAKKAYCRSFQTVFRAAIPVLPYRKPTLLGSTKELPALLRKKNISRVLLITDASIRGFGITKPLEDSLHKAHIHCRIYDRTVANPTNQNVEEARAMYLRGDCQAIIGFGGGSSIDCAKAVGARIAKPRQSLSQMEGILKVHKRLPTLIAIPTTAGTGSEATLAAICCTPLISQALPFPNPMSDMSTLSLIRSAESTTSRTDWQTPFCSRMYSRHTDRVSIKNCTNCLSASVCPAERTPIRSVRRPFSARSAR